jgi:peptide-methionine (S)-S-oxide reductase
VGYTGGQKKSPTYHDLGDHTEAIQVDFDPAQISYQALVGLFWQSHNPLAARRSRQYMSSIWYGDERQLDVINTTKEALEARLERELTTPVLPLEAYYHAEDYHQKYSLQRHHNLMSGFKGMYPEFRDIVDSTAAARLNGFAAGYGEATLFDEEKIDYGFALEDLKAVVRRR